MHIYQKCSYFKVRERKQTQGLKKKKPSLKQEIQKSCVVRAVWKTNFPMKSLEENPKLQQSIQLALQIVY